MFDLGEQFDPDRSWPDSSDSGGRYRHPAIRPLQRYVQSYNHDISQRALGLITMIDALHN